MRYEEAISKIKEADKRSLENSRKHWDSVAKPLRSLGLLEEAIIKIAGASGDSRVDLSKKALIAMCADNGVVEEGVTQTGQEVTAIVAENFTKVQSTVSIMCKMSNVDLFPVDIGIYRDMDEYLDESNGIKPSKIINRKISYGTKNFLKDLAMTREEAIKAIEVGINLVGELKEQGYKIIATGEMGIGNTTTSSAIASLLLNEEVEKVTGKGAGLSDSGLENKINVIKKAIEIHNPDINDPIDVLSKVGGYDIAGLVGVFIGGAVYNIPVLIDGFISAVSALVATGINPLVKDYLLPSHVSKEPAGWMLLNALGLKPLLTCEMCLGEGSGAVALLPILEMACKVYTDMGSFNDSNHEFNYVPL